MSNAVAAPYNVPISAWIEEAKPDPVRYLERQTTGILLHAIGITPELKKTLVLKGGILMSLVHGSYRQTGDVDFTAVIEPHPYADMLRESLDRALTRAAADLGYLDTVLAVQKFEYRPKADGFADMRAPALKISIGYAQKGTTDEARLRNRQSTRVLQVDISFKEPVTSADEITLDDTDVSIQTYAISEIIAEKYRAILQQVIRNRTRRQDVFDISWLLDRYNPDSDMQAAILQALITKGAERDIVPHTASLDDPEVRRRCQAEWEDMRLEVGRFLPDFDPTFEKVVAFYKALPWNQA